MLPKLSGRGAHVALHLSACYPCRFGDWACRDIEGDGLDGPESFA